VRRGLQKRVLRAPLLVRAIYAPWMPTRLDVGPFRYFYRVINPITRMLVRRFGVGGPNDDLLRVLRVRVARADGPMTSVRVNTLNGERFIVAMFGTAQWVKNLRATGEAEVVLGKAAEPVRVHELRGEDKLAFFSAYTRSAKLAKRVKAILGVDSEILSPDEFQRAIDKLPVFRLESSRDRYALR